MRQELNNEAPTLKQNKAEKLTDHALSNIIRNSENHPSIFKIKNNV